MMKKETPVPPAEKKYQLFEGFAVGSESRKLQLLLIPLGLFGLMGVLWAIPFPQLKFLGEYNAYFNWASFFIAVIIYVHLKMSPLVSYLLLFMLFAFSYGIIQLEQWHEQGGLSVALVAGIVLLIFLSAEWILYTKVKEKYQAASFITTIVNSPTWLMVVLAKKLKMNY
ncbi:hypothetical protein MUY27_11350 [Mucilaginibacter sp. RS28]|uniref:DUF962 domain-containing protein n=1 Tax=Mucilaginibacter straminoryzae TaxID=2932774 RepID=A0A9X1X4L6_9SPHI|nr:hypothetical protein [Mucilaginibacter straminoryzae]MCJ8210305.1 hypothetical protein [Mucilaginibacter straminoryzae]